MVVTQRDKRALILGSIAVTLLLAILLWPRGGSDSAVELVAADQLGPAPAMPAPAAAPPTAVVQPAAAPAVAPATPVPDGLKLTGITATGAIFAFPDGNQRLVPRGREVAPGLVLQAVRLRDVLMTTGPVTIRLGFSGTPTTLQPAAPPSVVVATPPPPTTASPVPAPPPPLDRNLFR